MAETDAIEWDPQKDEPADLSELDYDYTSVQDKIDAGLREKEKGNRLFAQGKYEAAWKQYDRCFVHVFTSKEEWAAIGSEGRNAINKFRLPCHLNRGLCRLKKDELTDALWDFTEALRIEENNAKGLFRRATTLIRMVEADMAKEGTDQLWDLDEAEKKADDAKKDLHKAVRIVPGDLNVRNALDELKEVKKQLAEHRKRYRQQQKKLYYTFVSNLDRDNRKITETEEDLCKDMPNLERVYID
ncbi:Peptidyl-prolyl cis-trans isomerase FKBP4 [Gracilariopsis chorda]|uniref:Peptidyl-prolyl cis-trans isomerase FKBP4 n=1 Tax=Gracilariopsis chorda TaxID=448386 RepID=A0A2V3IFN9_9FLOR|nr:Peptidyl-prolyl cis-trans isomerase FKBP4 [Gracilariopsis chorda]|eukprot:PXF40894.1 Peptidyl-prolyl cis-trans isomerase FKBP4 [Gracilariopsis chorda]